MILPLKFILAHALTFGSPEQSSVVAAQTVTESASLALRDSVVDYAKTFLGTPYKYACASPNGFDCSGFTWYVFNNFHITVPRSSKEYMNFGTRVPIDSARAGDIILFTGTNPKERRVGHVGIVISNPGDSLKFIHSSSSDNHYGVVITNYYASAYPKRFMGITSVINR
jgi:cell wall-associated NlpC family hydrolase